MKNINDDQTQKIDSLRIPSFKLEMSNQKMAELTNINVGSQTVSDASLTSSLNLISGLPSRGAPKMSQAAS